ncbi:chloride channel protein [Arenibacterium halophilum]|uniref:Chloride channel protein n=1 Tax=Arenibacterium halophilum TaxID=2583821 RepID=A0ABY2X9P7_9RHOB|nr:chloride channel protein [Arenibacterium halophilum]TMV12773.1 chloride channel protein [Arenibacterium halophilum]
MTNEPPSFLSDQYKQAVTACKTGWTVMRRRGPSQVQFWFIALVIGIAAGFAALFFRKGIDALQAALYGTDDVQFLHTFAQSLPWYWILMLPVLGGLIVGVILHRFTPDGRVRGVADVIEGAAMRDGRVERRAGAASMVASLITLSSGGSSGREGPVVHMAGVISTLVCRKINADGITGRDLLGCAVAAAVSASFNAPIAGALFALEVVLRHFAVHAFAPIVIASVAGTVINRLEFGDVTEFVLTTPGALQFYVELPAFLMLGLVCGVVAAALMRSVFWAEDLGTHLQRGLRLPRWLRPALAGAMLGALAIWYPHIIGVGYETTYRALSGDLILHEALVFAVLKTVAVAITFGGRMGGGIFSPSLMIGALTGLVFGVIATGVLPDVSGLPTLYAFAGMGAVAAAVLGAPISTTLIVFELTGDWQIGLAVMVSVSMSTALASRLVDRSFFLTQLERRNIHLAAGPQAYLLAMFRAGAVMRPMGDARGGEPDVCREMIAEGLFVEASATLEAAMPLFERADVAFLPVVTRSKTQPPELVGTLFHIDALKAYNRALAATAAEEHS